ncbi:MAG: hypothetical protein ABI036_08720 [Fibrobacteria bacterium]
MFELERINTAIIYQTLSGPTICPVARHGEFALEKKNSPSMAHATTEYINNYCSGVDSIGIDTNAVYLIPTSAGETFYMRLLSRDGSKVRVRIATERPENLTDFPAIPNGRLEDHVEFFDWDPRAPDTSEFRMVVGDYSDVIVIRSLAHPSSCPTTRSWNFELKKIGNSSALPLSQAIGGDCLASGSLVVDSNQVYEIYPATGGFISMRILGWTDHSLKARFTLQPSSVLGLMKGGKRAIEKSPMPGGEYRLNGRKVAAPCRQCLRPAR